MLSDPNSDALSHMNSNISIEIQKDILPHLILEVKKEIQQSKQKMDPNLRKENDKRKDDDLEKITDGNFNLNELNWPDPDPEINQNVLMLDDVTRMNAKEVDRIFMVRTTEDVRHVLKLARINGKTVSMRGTKHSMGGHTIGK